MSKTLLVKKLIERGLLWSYDTSEGEDLPNTVIIEQTLLFGDVPELKMLFRQYPKDAIKKIWLKSIVPDKRYKKINFYLARFFFNIKEINDFLKTNEKKYSRLEKLRLFTEKDR